MNKSLQPLILKKNSQAPAPSAAPAAKVERRSIYALKPHPKQEVYFPEASAADIGDLAADILANGLNEPLEITPDNRIISGHRRCLTLKNLLCDGHEEFASVQVKVRYDLAALGEEAIERRLLQANLNRRHLTVMEFARVSFTEFQLREPKKGQRLKLKLSIAGQFNVSVKKLETIWELLKLPLELQRLVDVKKLPQGVALALLKVAKTDEIEELRKLAVNEGPVRRRASKLIARREPVRLPQFDPRKMLNTRVLTAAKFHLHLPMLAEFLTELDNQEKLLKYREAAGQLLFAAGKLLELLDSLPQLQGVDDDPPIAFDETSWQETIRNAKERYSEYLEGENEDSPPVDGPAAQLAGKRRPPPLKLGPVKNLPTLKLKPANKPPPLKLQKRPPAA